MKDMDMDEIEQLRKELAKSAEKHSKHQIALEEIRRREAEMCFRLFELTGDQCYADASAHLRTADGFQRAAHAQDDLAGCAALSLPMPSPQSR